MTCSQPMECCSWKAGNITYPILPSSAGVEPCHCTGHPVDHCVIILPRVVIMNGHVDVFIKVEITLAQAVAQILGPYGH
jgi:hypothetical protein